MERVQYHIGDVVRMKKQHPCGSDLWKITRMGMDFGIRCEGCGHAVMIPRNKFERMARAVVETAKEEENGSSSRP